MTTPQEDPRDKVVELRRQGVRYREIARLTGVPLGSLQSIVREKAPELITPHYPPRPVKEKRYIPGRTSQPLLKAERNARLVADYEAGDVDSVLAARYGITHQRVHQIITKSGKRGVRRDSQAQRLEACFPKAVELWKAGSDLRDFALAHDVPLMKLRRRIGELDLPPRSRTLDYEAFIEDYRAGMSEVDIAAKHGATQSNVSRVMRQYAPELVEARREAKRAHIPLDLRMEGSQLGLVCPFKVIARIERGEKQGSIAARCQMSPTAISQIVQKHGRHVLRSARWPRG